MKWKSYCVLLWIIIVLGGLYIAAFLGKAKQTRSIGTLTNVEAIGTIEEPIDFTVPLCVAYSISIDSNQVSDFRNGCQSNCDYYTDIRIILDGVTRDFTLDDFKQKLGFEEVDCNMICRTEIIIDPNSELVRSLNLLYDPNFYEVSYDLEDDLADIAITIDDSHKIAFSTEAVSCEMTVWVSDFSVILDLTKMLLLTKDEMRDFALFVSAVSYGGMCDEYYKAVLTLVSPKLFKNGQGD